MKKDIVINVTKKTTNKIKEVTRKSNEAITGMVDANGDGKIDRNDVTVIIETRKNENDKKKLRPIFKEQATTKYSIINIVSEDKKRSASATCEGSVGYLTKLKQHDMLNIYEKNVDVLSAQFYPHISEGVYLLNPYQNDLYIKQDEYFNYLKKACINELEQVAQQLGAKYFMVSFHEKVSSITETKAKLKHGIKTTASASSEVTSESISKDITSTEIAAELEFVGNEIPTKPELIYFRNENDIEKLVHMRTNPKTENMITSKNYSFNCNSLSGISESLTAEINVALVTSGIGLKSSENFSRKKDKEKNTVLKYTIKF